MKDMRELLDAYLDGELTPGEQRQLQAWLLADRENARQFARETHAHQTLRESFAAAALQRELMPEPTTGRFARIRELIASVRGPRVRVACAAAVAALLAGGIVHFRGPSYSATASLLEIPDGLVVERKHQPVVPTPMEPLQAGDVIRTPPGRALVVGYQDGSRVELKGGGSLACPTARGSGKNLVLQDGQLTAVVAKQPRNRPMIVRTPEAEATVLGTEFRLTSARGMTHLDVISGAVALRARNGGSVTTVRGGESHSIGGPSASYAPLTLPARGTSARPALLLKLGRMAVEKDDGCRVASGSVVAHEGDDYVAAATEGVIVAHRGLGKWQASFRFALDAAPAAGGRVFWARWRQGGEPKVSAQTFDVWAGASAAALERRGTFRLTNNSPWEFDWVKAAQPLDLRTGDSVIEIRNSGQAHDAKVFQAFLLAPAS